MTTILSDQSQKHLQGISIEITPQKKDNISQSQKKWKPVNSIYRTNILNDQPYGDDYLNYDKYANTLSNVMLSDNIKLPLTVGILSAWGTGKSFLLKKIENEMKRDDNKKLIFVNFNAWEYSGADVLWAGLVKNIHEQVEYKFSSWKVRFFRHFIYPFRETNDGHLRFYHIIFWILRILFLIISTILLFYFSSDNSSIINNTNSTIATNLLTNLIPTSTIFGISLISIIPGLIKTIVAMCKNKGTDTEKSAKNIENKVGFMADVKAELEILCDFVTLNKYKFVIFIDDLDRCPPKKIIKVLDAIMLLLSNKDFPFLTFVTIEPRIVIQSIEASYNKNIKGYGISGYEYLDKLIQIPFCIPIPSPKTKTQMIEILVRDKVELLEQVCQKIAIFFDTHYLVSRNIKRSVNSLDYNGKIDFIYRIYDFLCITFNEFQKKKKKEKTIANMCYFINEILTTIDYRLNTSNDTINDIFNGSLEELDRIINYSKKNKILRPFTEDIEKSLDNNMNSLHNKIKNNIISDEEIILYGCKLLENNRAQDILDFSQDLKKFIVKCSNWSHYKIVLNNLSYEIQDALEKNIINVQDKIIKSFSDREITYFHKISSFFDGNCRRNKRIVNIYSLSRHLMGKKIKGWYHNKQVNAELLTKMIKLVVLTEQWPYKISWIFQKIEDMRQCLVTINEGDKPNKNSKSWIAFYENMNIYDILQLIPKELFYHKELIKLAALDYDSDIFKLFCKQKPYITIYTIYLLMPFLFNLDSSIKDKISEILSTVHIVK